MATLAHDSRDLSPDGRAAADTEPGAPARPRIHDLYDDPAFRALYDEVGRARAALADRRWDQLAHVERFTRCARFAARGTPFDAPLLETTPPRSLAPQPAYGEPLLARFGGDVERRAIFHLLWLLLPKPARSHLPLPDDVTAAADGGFRLQPGVLPRIDASWLAWCAPLGALSAEAGLVQQVFARGQTGGVLVPRAVSPGHAAGAAFVAHVVDEARVDGKAGLTLTAEPFVAPQTDDGRGQRLLPDGRPQRGVDGKPLPLAAPVELLSSWLFAAGPDARGLDLRQPDERCLLLTFAHRLKTTAHAGRSLWRWLEGARPDGADHAVVEAVVRAAHDVIAVYSVDPLACALRLCPDAPGSEGAWQARALKLLLQESGVCRAVGAVDDPSARVVVFADQVLARRGFAAGWLSDAAAGRAFARLATSVLAALGVLPLSGLHDGHGGVVLRTVGDAIVVDERVVSPLSAPQLARFDAPHAPKLTALGDAQREGFGLLLPDPRSGPRHDVQALPLWFQAFLDGLAAAATTPTTTPPAPAHGTGP